MPRTVDHEQRRRQIVEAVWRLLENGGLEGASVRGVAAETGLSTGSIRHFFGTQAELHTFALTSLTERVGARVQEAAAEPDVRRRILAMLGELLPLREDTHRELGIWFEFVHRSRHDAALSPIIDGQAIAVRAFLQQVVEGLSELGVIARTADVQRITAELTALVDGLTLQLLTAPSVMDTDRAVTLLETYLFG